MGGLVFMLTTLLVVLAGQALRHFQVLGPRFGAFAGDAAISLGFAGKEWGIGLALGNIGLWVIGIGFLCGVVGLLDDGAKVRNKANKGISGHIRLAVEFLLGLVLGAVLALAGKGAVMLPSAVVASALPFLSASTLAPAHPAAWQFIALPPLVLVLLGACVTASTTNAVNLHDGMDGLAAGTSCQVFATLAVLLYATGQPALAAIAATAAGALLGFLVFNKNPAQIFMGDTGSLFIGGLMGCLIVAGGLVFWFIPLSLIYVCETLSVIAQVAYFKLTKAYTPSKPMGALALAIYKLGHRLPGEGKRLFRMAPLHHHYEAVLAEKGWAEWQVVACFWLVQFILCLFTILLFYSFSQC
jgi:phospho-N-acetylmuramoyl-pentapeptide-transferase